MKPLPNKLTTNQSVPTEYILYSIDNYKSKICCLLQDILTKFLTIIIGYFNIITEKIMIKNKQYFIFILIRGLETIIHVFQTIFYYTKNLDLTFYHCQKAYYFYIEFIEQISDDNITFLQLTSRDAVLFVYKKTIYDLNNEYKKNINEPSEEDKNLLNILDIYINFYKLIIINTIYNQSNNNKILFDECYKCMENITEQLINSKSKKNCIEHIYLFTKNIYNSDIDITLFYNLIYQFTNKLILKKKINDKDITQKIYECSQFMNNGDFTLIISHIFKE